MALNAVSMETRTQLDCTRPKTFSQYNNKKGFVINQETVAIQHFNKFWANSQC